MSKATKKDSKKRAVKSKTSSGSSNSRNQSSGQTSQTAAPNSMNLHQLIRSDIAMGSRAVGQCFTPSYIADRNRISVTTVHNHIRQFHRDGDPVYKTYRGLVEPEHITSMDQVKVQKRLAKRQMGAKIEAGAVCPHIISTWQNTNRPDRIFVMSVARDLMANPNGNAWTGVVSQLYSIIDVDDPRNY